MFRPCTLFIYFFFIFIKAIFQSVYGLLVYHVYSLNPFKFLDKSFFFQKSNLLMHSHEGYQIVCVFAVGGRMTIV